MNKNIAERFARDIGPHELPLPYQHIGPHKLSRPHEMTILHDDGLHRHLRFRSPDHGHYWFELITVPGALIFRGDGDSYVFARTTDMFEFFRSRNGSINPHYWAEKLTIPGGRRAITEYDPDLFEQRVKEHVAEAIRFGDAPRGIGRAVTEMLRHGDIGWEEGARGELERFEHGAKVRMSCLCRGGAEFDAEDYAGASLWRSGHRGIGHMVDETRIAGWRFHDTYEWSFRDYDWWFLWACTAIVYGIAKYDEARAATGPELVGAALAGGV